MATQYEIEQQELAAEAEAYHLEHRTELTDAQMAAIEAAARVSRAHEAIAQSVEENRIIDVSASRVDVDTLICESDDSADENDGSTEYWGTTESGGKWRVSVTGVVTDEQIAALSDEAAAAGDDAQVALCARALAGDDVSRAHCERVIRYARREAEAS